MTSTQFQSAIEAVFKGWTALQLAVTHSFGGVHSKAKADWLVGATEQWLQENSDVDSYELEEFLAEIMSSEFNTVVDDNSLAEVATKVCRIYQLVQQGKTEEVNTMVSSLRKSAGVSSSQRQQEESSDDEEGEDMDLGEENVMSHMNALELSRSAANMSADSTAQSTESPLDHTSSTSCDDNDRSAEDDGWTTVTKGGKKKKGR